MRKILFPATITSIIFLTGCLGGGGTSGSDSNKTYDLRDYLIANDSAAKKWDQYIQTEDGYKINHVKIAETAEIDMGDIIETSNFGTIYFFEQEIKRQNRYGNFSYVYNRFISIGDKLPRSFLGSSGNCEWSEHSRSIKLSSGETYSDILTLTCPSNTLYFAKGNGNIASKYTENGIVYKYVLSEVKIGELTFGDIINQFGGKPLSATF